MRTRTALAIVFLASNAALGADWPCFLGPNRNGSSPETGLLAEWPAQGPKVVWKVAGGIGYAQVTVSKERAYVVVQRQKDEVCLALDATTGKEMWSKRIGSASEPGPSATPAVDGGRLYVQSMGGALICLEAEKGTVVWERNLLKEFASRGTIWGMTVSPLIEGNLVLTVSGGKGAGVVALNKMTGEVVWKKTDDKLAFSSPVVMSVDGQKQAIFLTDVGIVAVQLDDGTVRWRFPWVGGGSELYGASPLVVGNRLFLATGDDSALIAPAQSGDPKVVWGPNEVLRTYLSTAVHHEQHLFGNSGGYNINRKPPHLNCVEAATGKVIWSREKFGQAHLTLADGNLYMLLSTGELVVAPATPNSYQEKGRSQVLEKATYVNAPTIAGKKLYARDQKSIICLDLAGK
jgi:outer membrane protein assembly factor BamB